MQTASESGSQAMVSATGFKSMMHSSSLDMRWLTDTDTV